MEPPQYEPIATLGKLGDYQGVPFFREFFWGSGAKNSFSMARSLMSASLCVEGGWLVDVSGIYNPIIQYAIT